MTLEDELTDALQAHADQFEPSADSYRRLQQRVAAEARPAPHLGGPLPLGPRLLVAAVLLLVLGGIGAFAFQRTAGENVQAVASTSTIDGELANTVPGGDADSEASASEPVDDSAGGPNSDAIGPPLPGLAPAPSGVLGPRARSAQTAAQKFLELIQRSTDDAVLEVDGPVVHVRTRLENGEFGDVADLLLGAIEFDNGDPGYVVVGAMSANVRIESPAALATVTDSRLRIGGQGRGFEARLAVDVYSADDGVALVKTWAMAGGGEALEPFEITVDVAGSEPAWVVVSSTGGTEAHLEPFSAVPIVLNAPQRADTYAVAALAPDDADQGLVFRHLPGTEEGERLGSLPFESSGIRRRGVPSRLGAGNQEWWNIELPAPIDGRHYAWVNSAFLIREGEVASTDLESIGWQFARGVVDGEQAELVALPWTTRRSVMLGWSGGLQAFDGASLAESGVWDAERTWVLPQEAFSEGETMATARALFDPFRSFEPGTRPGNPDNLTVTTGTDLSMVSPYGGDQQQLRTRFHGASWVQIADAEASTPGWKVTTLFVEAGVDGPEIVGVVSTVWIP